MQHTSNEGSKYNKYPVKEVHHQEHLVDSGIQHPIINYNISKKQIRRYLLLEFCTSFYVVTVFSYGGKIIKGQHLQSCISLSIGKLSSLTSLYTLLPNLILM